MTDATYINEGWTQRPILTAAEAQWLDRAVTQAKPDGITPTFNEQRPPIPPWVKLLLKAARHPNMVQFAIDLLGPDVLIRNVDVFTRSMVAPTGVSWHRDLPEAGSDPDGLVTVWLPVTHVGVGNAPLQVLPESHHLRFKGPTLENLEIPDEQVAAMPGEPRTLLVPAGTAIALHGLLLHRSDWPTEPGRRTAIAVRYVRPTLDPESIESGQAAYVVGRTMGRWNRRKIPMMQWHDGGEAEVLANGGEFA